MEIVRRKKTGGQGKTSTFSEKKVKYNFDIGILNLMCSYVLSTNKNIKKSHIVNMRNLFDSLDLSIYEADIEKLKRIQFIRRGIDARLKKDLSKPALILTYIKGNEGLESDQIDVLDPSGFEEMSNSELSFVNETIAGALKCTFIENDMDNLFELYTRYKSQDYRYRAGMVEEIETYINTMNSKFRRAKADSMGSNCFSLDPTTFEHQVSDIYDTLFASNRFLSSGMQGFNMIVGGAFESTRFYLLLGMAGIGKSMVLLNLALQIKKYNKSYQTKDPTKKPTILFLTQENSVDETVDRICDMVAGKNMKHFEKQEIIDILRTDGELTVEGDNNINIHIVFRPDRSIDTGDLYSMIEDLEDDGYEVICLIQDHIKRIRSTTNFNGDMRLELGAVVNEMKIVAQLKEIPVISVSHLNRDAAKVTESAAIGNKTDLTRLLGRSNIGESMLMMDNADCVIIVNKDFDEDGNAYAVFSLQKIRNATPAVSFICQPFEKGSSTKLVDDVYETVPAFRESLKPLNQMNNSNSGTAINGVVMKNSSYTNINALDAGSGEMNFFEPFVGTKYSSAGLEIQNTIDDMEFENVPLSNENLAYNGIINLKSEPVDIKNNVDTNVRPSMAMDLVTFY